MSAFYCVAVVYCGIGSIVHKDSLALARVAAASFKGLGYLVGPIVRVPIPKEKKKGKAP